jgi:3',5'-cyclic AMP phosphodiesterase CpdA
VMRSFGWLHFTDLHQGLDAQGWLWPGVRDVLFTDLEQLHERCGPWDLVLFSGDLTQRGSRRI